MARDVAIRGWEVFDTGTGATFGYVRGRWLALAICWVMDRVTGRTHDYDRAPQHDWYWA